MPLHIHLISGFLGSGKTKVMLDLAAHLPEAAFMTSDAAAIPFDRDLLAGGRLPELSGCICCASKSDALATIGAHAAALTAETHADLFIESSGMSDIVGLVDDIAGVTGAQLATIITLVDASQPIATLAELHEARGQLALADVCLLTHLDALSPEISAECLIDARAALLPLVRQGCPILVRPDAAAVARLFKHRMGHEPRPLDRLRALAGASAHDLLKTCQLQLPAALGAGDALALAQAILCLNPRLMRLKMRVRQAEQDGHRRDSPAGSLLVQIVNGRLQPLELLNLDAAVTAGPGLLHIIDPVVGAAEILPLAELFLGVTPPHHP